MSELLDVDEHEPSDGIDSRVPKAHKIASAMPKKPWYKSPTIAISICALIFSVLSSLLSAVSFEHEQQKQDMDELQTLAVQLSDNRKSILEIMMNPSSQAAASGLANTLNVKQKMLLSRADAIAHSLSSGITAHFFSPQISPEITWVLGNEHQSFGEYRQATDFFKLAMQSGDSDTAQVFAPRAQAMLDMLPATGVQSIKEGEDLFQEAINHIKGTDDISIEIKGDTYYDWGTSEYNANNPSGGLNKLDMAEKAYSSLHIANPDRANRLQGVELQRTTLFGLSDTGISIAKTLVGTWAITGSMSSGQLVISNEANSGQFIGNLSKHPSTWGPEAALVFNEVGTIAVQDASHASFNWKLQNGLLGMKAQGTSVLTINSGEGLIVVAEPSDAPAPTKYTLKRVQH